MKRKKVLFIVCTLFALSSVFFTSIKAPFIVKTEAAMSNDFRGNTATEPILLDKDSPLRLQSKKITYDISIMPDCRYFSVEEFNAYPNTLISEYTFSNPTNQDIEATFVFPLEREPDYACGTSYKGRLDFDKVQILQDGVTIEKDIRYTFVEYNWRSIQEIVSWEQAFEISNEYETFEFLRTETPVKKYNFKVLNIPEQDRSTPCVCWEFSFDTSKTKIFREYAHYRSYNDKYYEGVCASRNQFPFYVIGEPFHFLPNEWFVFESSAWISPRLPDAVVSLDSIESMSFRDFVFMYYDEYDKAKGIKEIDWYNAYIKYLYEFKDERNEELDDLLWPKFEQSLLPWYEYKITFPANSSVSYTLKRPAYPHIEGNSYTPSHYVFSYWWYESSFLTAYTDSSDEYELPYDFDIIVNVSSYEPALPKVWGNKIATTGFEHFKKTDEGYHLQVSTAYTDGVMLRLAGNGTERQTNNRYRRSVFDCRATVQPIVGIFTGVFAGAMLFIKKKKRK